MLTGGRPPECIVLGMGNSKVLRTNALNPGNSHTAVAAITTILDNIVLHLTRYDLEKAAPLAEMLMSGRLREHRLYFDVLHTSALAGALRRGLAQIRRLAPVSALIEFRRAQVIWSQDTNQADDDGNAVLENSGRSRELVA
jgi:hypothetical protein